MRYAFINNFSHVLAASITESAGQMTLLSGTSDISNANTRRWYRLTLIEEDAEGVEVDREVVEVRSVSGSNINIQRGQEGTTPRAWDEGTKVEMRVTAGVASGWVYSEPSNDLGNQAVSLQPSRTSWQEVAGGFGCVAIGYKSSALWSNAIALGLETEASGNGAISIGRGAVVEADTSIAIGEFSHAESENSICFGLNASVGSDSQYAMAMGDNASVSGEGSVSLGHLSACQGDGQLALGTRAYAGSVQSAMCLTAVPVMRASLRPREFYQHPLSSRVSLAGLFQSQNVSLATTGDKDAITLPAGAALCIDRIEALVVSSAESGSTPTISIGTTEGGDDILSGHVMAGDTVLSREQLVASPLANAVTALYFKADTAAAAAMTVRFVVHGYVMET